MEILSTNKAHGQDVGNQSTWLNKIELLMSGSPVWKVQQ